ncbi:hypothetical protein E1258_02425 [Micromonospora sp. KC207]|uniref:hypothetical protein n=1 Tax=Micromonospora sp. KC207 TaxID=2530377 RepID=UPI00104B9721|nr:hypothetical protein [Micromonospora sp. KC207]TDC66552.1 hypothetical protein E1258_02425 [Micromonospora sp. KC207]
MTAGGFREVDHDLLADYLGGALDGTPDKAMVARLVAEEPAWAAAHDALVPALARVADALAAWAEPAPQLPPAVADRIAAALAGAGPGTPPRATDQPTRVELADQVRAGRVPAQPGGGTRWPAGGPRSTSGRPGRRGRRWARLAGPVALAAASVVAVGLGLNQVVSGGSDQSDGAAGQAISAQAEAGGAFALTGEPQRSGTDWTPEALSADDRPQTQVSKPAESSFGAGPDAPAQSGGGDRLPAAGGLNRLTGNTALADCLAAVSAEHGAGPLTVDLVDYARFQGNPALVLRFVDPSGARWAWVSGPECGVPGSGADTRYQTRVG